MTFVRKFNGRTEEPNNKEPMSEPCDDCGADGEALQCICEKEPNESAKKAKSSAPIKRPDGVQKLPGGAAKTDTGPRSRDVPLPGVQGAQKAIAPLSVSGAGSSKVICCRCRHVHLDIERLNEWGLRAGKVMAGRRTECPNGCGYHVTIPYDASIHGGGDA